MIELVVLFLTLSGLQAAPIAAPRALQESSSTYRLPDGFRQGTEHYDVRDGIPDDFRQGTEPSRRVLVDLNTGLAQEVVSEMERRAAVYSGSGEMERRAWLTDEVPADVPSQRNGGGWVRMEEPSTSYLLAGFRQGTEPKMSIPDGFRQGTEPKMSIPDGFRQGTEPKMSIPDGFRQGTEPKMSIPDGFRQGTEPKMSIPDGFRQGTEPKMSIPDGFRQGTEPKMSISVGFKQGTEQSYHIPEGFKQGTEPSLQIPEGFRQGTEPILRIPQGFRQGTEPILRIPQGFRQGTEPVLTVSKGFRQETHPSSQIPEDFRQGTEPILTIPKGFRQGTEPSTHSVHTQTVACKGEIINENCYEFNPTPLSFKHAQSTCRALAPNAELASVTSRDLHSRLVSLVTKGGGTNPVLTWLGAMVEEQQASWLDGSEWTYSDWMPGHPNVHTDKPVCVEMFKIDESWWTASDCELERASICSYPISA
ncbi:uncharacterized protein LOC114432617 isoform X2 [Parambassis ranga]|uniref:Uncharacterized protein LOC114432617 isoform X2 n=1 Tax=Parambassis ranga TaxID=210632 RepID=A0A6P7HLN4_9TELE|nr:uncharacterized protein LOC114432617 isoform X2 [Parambassis ranga]